MVNFNCIYLKRRLLLFWIAKVACSETWNTRQSSKKCSPSATNLYTSLSASNLSVTMKMHEKRGKSRAAPLKMSETTERITACNSLVIYLFTYLRYCCSTWCQAFFSHHHTEPGRNKHGAASESNLCQRFRNCMRPSLCAQERRVHNSNLISNCTFGVQ